MDEIRGSDALAHISKLSEGQREARNEILERIMGQDVEPDERITNWKELGDCVRNYKITMQEYMGLFTERERRLIYEYFKPVKSLVFRWRAPFPH